MESAVVTPPHLGRPLRLEPFRALRLPPSRVADPASVRTFARPYPNVAERLTEWERTGLLVEDPAPALYLHEYTGSGLVVRGLVGRLDVSRRATSIDDRSILPHEGIHPAQADALAARMAEMALNPAPILLVHQAPRGLRDLLRQVRTTQRSTGFSDRAGHAHRIWTIADGTTLARIAAELAPGDALIADGHHRYAAYLRLQRRAPGTEADGGLAMLVDQGDSPLFLGAIHRLLTGTSLADLADAVRAAGMSHRICDADTAISELARTTLVATDGHEGLVVDEPLEAEMTWVETLHRRLIPALRSGPATVEHHHFVGGALDRCEPGSSTAVLLPAPTFDQVLATARAGRLLPEKATSFQPKPPFGVLLRTLHDR